MGLDLLRPFKMVWKKSTRLAWFRSSTKPASPSYGKAEGHPARGEEGLVDIVPGVIGDDDIIRESIHNKIPEEVCATDYNSVPIPAEKDSQERHNVSKISDSMIPEDYLKLNVDSDFSGAVQIDIAIDDRNLEDLPEIIAEEEKESEPEIAEVLRSSHGEKELTISVKRLIKLYSMIPKDDPVDQRNAENKNGRVKNNQTDDKELRQDEQAENMSYNRGGMGPLIGEKEGKDNEEAANGLHSSDKGKGLSTSVKRLIKHFSRDHKDEAADQPNIEYEDRTHQSDQASHKRDERDDEQAVENLHSYHREKEPQISVQELINRFSGYHKDNTGGELRGNGIEKKVSKFAEMFADMFRSLERARSCLQKPATEDLFSQNLTNHPEMEPTIPYDSEYITYCDEAVTEIHARIRARCENIAQILVYSLSECRPVAETNDKSAMDLCVIQSQGHLKSEYSSVIPRISHVSDFSPHISVQELIKKYSICQIDKQDTEKITRYADSCLPEQGCVRKLKAKYSSNHTEDILTAQQDESMNARCSKMASTETDQERMKPFAVESDRESEIFPQTLDSKHLTIKQRIQQLLASSGAEDNRRNSSPRLTPFRLGEHKSVLWQNQNIAEQTIDFQKRQEEYKSLACGGYKSKDSSTASLSEFLEESQQGVSASQTCPRYPFCLNNVPLQSLADMRAYSGHHVLQDCPNFLRRSKGLEDIYRECLPYDDVCNIVTYSSGEQDSNFSSESFEVQTSSSGCSSSDSKEKTVAKKLSGGSNSSGFYESIEQNEPRSSNRGRHSKTVDNKFIVNLYESRTATSCSNSVLRNVTEQSQTVHSEDALQIKNTDDTYFATKRNRMSKINNSISEKYFAAPSKSGISSAKKLEDVNVEVPDLRRSDSDAVDESLKIYLPPTGTGEEVEKDSHETYLLLRHQADIQATTIHQATKALELCKKFANLVIHTEIIEAERALLLATCKYDQIRREIQRNNYGPPRNDRVDNLGTILINKLHLPLVAINRKCQQYRQYFVVVLSHNTTVLGTKVVECDYEKKCVRFEDNFAFENLTPDFVVTVDIYNLILKQKGKNYMSRMYFGKKQETCRPRKKLYYKDVQSFMLVESLVAQSSFKLCGSVNISLENLHKGTWRIQKFCDSMVDDFLNFNVNISDVKIMTTKRGFLTLGAHVNDRLLWCRRWCVLEGPILKFFNYPDDEGSVVPTVIVNLRHCLSDKVEVCDRETCARARTLELSIGTVIGAGDVMKAAKKNRVSDTQLLNADSDKEMLEWREQLNFVINALGQWNKLEFIENPY